MSYFSDHNLQVWRQREADAYFIRNRKALLSLESAAEDLVIKLLLPFLGPGDVVLELGCANAWRLRRLASVRPDLKVTCGIDLSHLGLQDGMQRGSKSLLLADASMLPIRNNSVDCLILGFVCYAVGRRSALAVLAEAERIIQDDGVIAILDFLPDAPTENPYHHVPNESIGVIKTDFAAALVAYGGYHRVGLAIQPPETAKQRLRSLSGSDRIGVTLLQRSTLSSDR